MTHIWSTSHYFRNTDVNHTYWSLKISVSTLKKKKNLRAVMTMKQDFTEFVAHCLLLPSVAPATVALLPHQ